MNVTNDIKVDEIIKVFISISGDQFTELGKPIIVRF